MNTKYIRLLWRIAYVRLFFYIIVTVGTAYGISTYNKGWSTMDGDQRIDLVIALVVLAAKDIISFLDASSKRIESGNYLPPDTEDPEQVKEQIQEQIKAAAPVVAPVDPNAQPTKKIV